jgi:outer membrane protein TolC
MKTARGIRAAAMAALMAGGACAQPAGLTMAQAVEAALHSYPAIGVSRERANAAAAAIALARTAYLPRVDALAQVNRATRNNVFGVLLPQSAIPSMSGPVLGTNNFGTAWGSAIGTLVTWEPFDFGLRRAGVAAAEATRAQAEAAVKRTGFEVSANAAAAYLTLAAAQETVRAAQAAVERAATLATSARALVGAELRPGADASRADAELAAARTQLARASQAVEIARAGVSQYVGVEPERIEISAPGLLQLPPEEPAARPDPAAHPAAVEQSAVVEQSNAQMRTLERQWFPRFYLQGAAYARGTGAETNGGILGGVNGLAPSVQDYALGFTATFPVFEFVSIRERERVQAATVRASEARSRQIATDLRAQWNMAYAELRGARQVAANTPVEVAAAHAAAEQAGARYQAGLGAIDQVAEAQRLLAQAEIDDALARLAVWRALLSVAVAAGDLQPFLAQVGK